MADSSGTKTLTIITICIMLISIGLGGCVEDGGEDIRNIKYSVEIESFNNFTLLIPFPTYSNEKKSDLIENLKIRNGEGNFNIIDSEHGKALEIIGKSNLSIYVEIDKKKNAILSMFDNNKTGYGINGNWFFCNCINTIEISLDLYETFPSGFDHSWINNYKLRNGWQLIKLENIAGSE